MFIDCFQLFCILDFLFCFFFFILKLLVTFSKWYRCDDDYFINGFLVATSISATLLTDSSDCIWILGSKRYESLLNECLLYIHCTVRVRSTNRRRMHAYTCIGSVSECRRVECRTAKTTRAYLGALRLPPPPLEMKKCTNF